MKQLNEYKLGWESAVSGQFDDVIDAWSDIPHPDKDNEDFEEFVRGWEEGLDDLAHRCDDCPEID